MMLVGSPTIVGRFAKNQPFGVLPLGVHASTFVV